MHLLPAMTVLASVYLHILFECFVYYSTLHFGHLISAALNELLTTELLTVKECTQVVEEGNRWGEYLTLILASKFVEEEASEVLEKHGCHVKDLKRRFWQLRKDECIRQVYT